MPPVQPSDLGLGSARLKLESLLPAKAHIRSLPSARNPRLYLTGSSFLERWQQSSFYPAFRRTAQLYKVFLRVKAALGFCAIEVNPEQKWIVEDFVSDVFTNVCNAVILVGTPGPAQKFTVQLWEDRRVIGYLKYAEKPAAILRLKREYHILLALPYGLGPVALKYSAMGNGMALLTTPIVGKQISARLPPRHEVLEFSQRFGLTEPLTIDRHPWACAFRTQHGKCADRWFEVLSHRNWPVTVHHGDFAPWNIISTSAGLTQAIDWEYGSMQGFPHIDIVHYLLQVAFLINRWSPESVTVYVIKFLCQSKFAFTECEAMALIRLTARHAYSQALEDGHSSNSPLQTWRRTIWDQQTQCG